MDYPFPGMKVFVESDGQLLEYLDTNGNIQTVKSKYVAVSNYEYEVKKNEEKRVISILKPELVGAVEADIRDIMKYGRSSQFVDSSTKRAYNPRSNR